MGNITSSTTRSSSSSSYCSISRSSSSSSASSYCSISSCSSASSAIMQLATNKATASNHISLFDPRLLRPLLHHTSISQDQQAVATLLMTSKQLQEAVAEVLAGQLPVVLYMVREQRLRLLAAWLCKHAGLVKSLAVQRVSLQTRPQSEEWRTAASSALERTLAAAAASGSLQLQSFSFGDAAGPGLLQQLPAAHLTQLKTRTLFNCAASFEAVARLTSLRELRLTKYDYTTSDDASVPAEGLQRFAAGLRQLTQLQMRTVTPAQLQLLPPQLQQLHAGVLVDWGSATDIATLCRPQMTVLHSLCIATGDLPGADRQQDTVLAPLSALQLTRLKLGDVRSVQLHHLQLPQLQQLVVNHTYRQQGQLRMGHITALRKLSMQHLSTALRVGDQMPPNLQELHCGLWGVIQQEGDARECMGLEIILALTRLEVLQLEFGNAATATAEELQQLSSLSSLQEVRLSFMEDADALAADAAAALQARPLKSFDWVTLDISDLLLQQLAQLQGLTQLELQAMAFNGHRADAVLGQLAPALQQLTELRCFDIYAKRDDTNVMEPAGDSVEGVKAFLQAVGGLSLLGEVRVKYPCRLRKAAQQQLRCWLQQQLPSKLAQGRCRVDKNEPDVWLCTTPISGHDWDEW
uniref:Uncharacterized protein n=1 Tax=Tetradesmus obliquus TaxID=3088 RepID=A0A383WIA1_TETOB|eukprot:jgi/Sobl393_1/1280/SZX77188.1